MQLIDILFHLFYLVQCSTEFKTMTERLSLIMFFSFSFSALRMEVQCSIARILNNSMIRRVFRYNMFSLLQYILIYFLKFTCTNTFKEMLSWLMVEKGNHRDTEGRAPGGPIWTMSLLASLEDGIYAVA